MDYNFAVIYENSVAVLDNIDISYLANQMSEVMNWKETNMLLWQFDAV